jgi:DNA invertase Pin-like site-specific DNA recombinase
MKRAALYMRVSTVDQHPETQLFDLRQMAAQRGYEVVQEFTDRISGAKAKRPGLDQMMADARRGRFDIVMVCASDRIARSVKHYLEVLDELNRLNIEFISFRENIDTSGPLGRAIVIIIAAIAELERSLIVERVRAGMWRARLEGTHIGRQPLTLDNDAIQNHLPTLLLQLLFRPQIISDMMDVFIAQDLLPRRHVERRSRRCGIVDGRHPAVADDRNYFVLGVVVRDVK